LYQDSSVSIIFRELAINLFNLGYDVKICPIDQIYRKFEHIERLQPLEALKAPADAQIDLVLQYCSNRELQPEIPTIIYEPHEPTTYSKAELDFLKHDEVKLVWVPSNAAKSWLIKFGIAPDKIIVCPHGFDPYLWQAPPNDFGDRRPVFDFGKRFIFYDYGMLSERKGTHELIRAYLEEFSADEPVLLFLLTTGSLWATELKSYIQAEVDNHPNRAPIFYHAAFLSQSELYSYLEPAHCLVHPHRTESFGLCVLEAKAMNMPVITTNYGGVLDFSSEEDTYLVWRQIQTAEGGDGLPQEFVIADKDHLRYLMRYVYDNYDAAKERAYKSLLNVQQNFTWQAVVKRWVEILKANGYEISKRAEVMA